ncbi:hypothetical protein ACGFYA_05325 [Streptomyces sp. NPDC048305]|uniref:hypothetical protein n=1 Tax=Streptomyces sp. NPDC048305 TaxID=3365532 RepID=UPI00371A7D85
MDVKLGEVASRQVSLLARAWGVDAEGVVLRLLDHFEAVGGERSAEAVKRGVVAVHARYAGHKVCGEFDLESRSLVITSGLAQGRYKSPSGAATAAVKAYKPEADPHRNGWSFWIVDATGARLQSLR